MESLDVMDIKQHNVKSIVNVLRFSAGGERSYKA